MSSEPTDATKRDSLVALMRELNLRDLRNVILGTVVVSGGVALALATLYAHRTGNVRLAGIAAGISLIFALVILVFVVPPLARNARREAQQLNLPFELTLAGAVMLVLIMVVGFSAWNTGNNLLFLVFSFLVAALVIGFMAGALSLRKLDVKLRLPDTIFANEATPISLTLDNRKRLLSAYSVVVDIRGIEEGANAVNPHLANLLPHFLIKSFTRASETRRTLAHFTYLKGRSVVESRLDYLFEKRGRFTIKNFELMTRFPFGFFRHRRRLSARETELIVFPQLSESVEIALAAESGAARVASQKVGTGLDLLSLRDYRRDDDLRKIDWKATARAQTLTVREFAAEDDLKATLIFDRRMPDGVEAERFETGVTMAASAVSAFFEQRAEFRILIDGEGEFGMGREHWMASMTRLALVQPDPESGNDAAKPQKTEQSDGFSLLVTAQEAAEGTATLKILHF